MKSRTFALLAMLAGMLALAYPSVSKADLHEVGPASDQCADEKTAPPTISDACEDSVAMEGVLPENVRGATYTRKCMTVSVGNGGVFYPTGMTIIVRDGLTITHDDMSVSVGPKGGFKLPDGLIGQGSVFEDPPPNTSIPFATETRWCHDGDGDGGCDIAVMCCDDAGEWCLAGSLTRVRVGDGEPVTATCSSEGFGNPEFFPQ